MNGMTHPRVASLLSLEGAPLADRPRRIRGGRLVFVALMLAGAAHAAPVPLDDTALSEVRGGEGIGLVVHLELNSGLLTGDALGGRLAAGFKVDGTTTYAVLDGIGGVMDLMAVTLNVKTRSDGGGDYLELGLPAFVSFNQFGFRALGAQTDPNAAVTQSYGQVLLHGNGSMTGRVLLWGQ